MNNSIHYDDNVGIDLWPFSRLVLWRADGDGRGHRAKLSTQQVEASGLGLPPMINQ